MSFQIKITTKEIGAEDARAYLAANCCDNRNIRQTIVNRFARDMVAGEWKLTSDTLKFGVDGILIDGQHRCCGLIEADRQKPGVKIVVCIAENIPADAYPVIDSGSRREAADGLRMSGVQKYTAEKAALAKRCILFEAGRNALYSTRGKGLEAKHQLTTAEIVGYVKKKGKEKELEPCIVIAKRLYPEQMGNSLSPTDLSFTVWLLSKNLRAATDKVLAFLEKLVDPFDATFVPFYRELGTMRPAQKMTAILDAFKKYN